MSTVELLVSEGLITMKAAAAVAGLRHGSTPTRWARVGIRRADGSVLKLESVRSGGALRTSRAAVLRFIEAQTASAASPVADVSPAPGTPKRRANRAASELDALLGSSSPA